MDKKLVKQIIEYIEGIVEQLDAEYGENRNFKEILKDDYDSYIPEIYYKLKKMLNE